jgi:hypothetical protein
MMPLIDCIADSRFGASVVDRFRAQYEQRLAYWQEIETRLDDGTPFNVYAWAQACYYRMTYQTLLKAPVSKAGSESGSA